MPALLRCASHYSYLTGLLSPRELCELAVQREIAHLGLCDWGGLYGHPAFAKEAERVGVHALYGVLLGGVGLGDVGVGDVGVGDVGLGGAPGFGSGEGRPEESEGRFVLLARDERGYRLLTRVVSRYRLETASLLRVLVEELENCAHGSGPEEHCYVLCEEPQDLERLAKQLPKELLRVPLPPMGPWGGSGQGGSGQGGARQGGSGALGRSRGGRVRRGGTATRASAQRAALVEREAGLLDAAEIRKVPDPGPAPRRVELEACARALGLRCVAAPFVYYADPEHHAVHRLAIAAKKGLLFDRVHAEEQAPLDSFFPSREALLAAYAGEEFLVEEAERMARSCTLSLARPRRLVFPGARVSGERPIEVLRARAEAGFLRLHGWQARDRLRIAKARLKQELRVIEDFGFAPYFLVVDEIVALARSHEIPCLGRGSAADSLVAHCLGFTDADPLRYGLCFERFLNAERFRREEAENLGSVYSSNALPDIDLDFCWRRRDELLELVTRRFGVGKAALLSTQTSLGFRAAYREAARAFGLSLVDVDRRARGLPRKLPEETVQRGREAWQKDGDPELLAALLERAPELRARLGRVPGGPEERRREARIWRGAFALTGLQRYLGLHPGGTVLSPDLLYNHAPLERSAKGLPVVQWDKYVAPHMGLVKIDLLGNRGLSVYEDAKRELVRLGVDVQAEFEDVESPGGAGWSNQEQGTPEQGTPEQGTSEQGTSEQDGNAWGAESVAERSLRDPRESGRDARTARMLCEGKTLGCWQIESPGMRSLLIRMEAQDMGDVIQAVALIRPGPAGSGMMERFIRRARGQESTEEALQALPPALRRLLGPSRGVMLYQEDVIHVLAALCGVSLGHADLLRRRLGKRDGPEALEAKREYFERVAARGIQKRLAAEFWAQIERFAAYSFCKAHAVTYGRLAWRIAVCKSRYPAAVLGSLLANDTGYYEKRVYVDEAKRLGIPVLSPCVNRSERNFRCELLPFGKAASRRGGQGWRSDAGLRVGLGEIRELPERFVEAILRERREAGPFFNIDQFVERIEAQGVPVQGAFLERLILVGAFDLLEGTRPEKLWRARLLFGMAETGRVRQREGQAAEGALLFPDALLPKAPVIPCLPEFREEERARFEFEILGFTTVLHPLALARAGDRGLGDRGLGDPGRGDSGRVDPRQGALPLEEAPSFVGKVIRIEAWLAAQRRHRSVKSGLWMCFLTFEDETGMLEAVLFPDAYARLGAELSGQGRYRARGRVESRDSALLLEVQGLEYVGPIDGMDLSNPGG